MHGFPKQSSNQLLELLVTGKNQLFVCMFWFGFGLVGSHGVTLIQQDGIE